MGRGEQDEGDGNAVSVMEEGKNVINARPTSDFRYTGNIATESVLKKMTGVFLSIRYNCPV